MRSSRTKPVPSPADYQSIAMQFSRRHSAPGMPDQPFQSAGQGWMRREKQDSLGAYLLRLQVLHTDAKWTFGICKICIYAMRADCHAAFCSWPAGPAMASARPESGSQTWNLQTLSRRALSNVNYSVVITHSPAHSSTYSPTHSPKHQMRYQ